ncbi:MAG: ParB N-terminal domain-containing protein, partial [Afipia sp.]|nr:ParB N-terminal domain-containing protein [Afipia sp.]
MSDRQDLVSLGRNSPFLQIEDIAIGELKPNPRNARKHPDEQITMLARNIDAVGLLVPCLIDEANELLTGTARVMAAERLGMKTVPAIRVSHLNEMEKRAFVIADNKLAEMAVWDADALRRELQFFNDLNIDFDFSVIGFKTAEVDFILDSADADGSDEPLPNLTGPAVSRLGDLWQAGAHRIYCGDALDTTSYEALLANERAQLVFTDPPYNISIG